MLTTVQCIHIGCSPFYQSGCMFQATHTRACSYMFDVVCSSPANFCTVVVCSRLELARCRLLQPPHAFPAAVTQTSTTAVFARSASTRKASRLRSVRPASEIRLYSRVWGACSRPVQRRLGLSFANHVYSSRSVVPKSNFWQLLEDFLQMTF